MKWVFENHEGTKVYYSADVIERIKKIATSITQDYDGNQAHRMIEDAEEILKIIKNEDK